MEKEKGTNENLFKLMGLIKMIPLETLQDMDKLDAALDVLGIDDQEKINMIKSLEKYLYKLTKGQGMDAEVFTSYEEALDHFFKHVYKNFLKTAPKNIKPLLYRLASEYNKPNSSISDSRIHQILDIAGYTIVHLDDDIRISYPLS